MIEIRIQRPNGKIETVRKDGFESLSPAMWAKFVEANRAAGRGECLDWRTVDTRTEAERAWDRVDRLWGRAEAVADDPVRYIAARRKAIVAEEAWTAQYPDEAARRAREAAERRQARIGEGVKRALRGED